MGVVGCAVGFDAGHSDIAIARGDTIYAAYHLRVDELTDEVVQILKRTYRHGKIVILPKDVYTLMEKEQHNANFSEKTAAGYSGYRSRFRYCKNHG